MELPFKLLFEDENILVCIKPANIPTQSKNIRTPDMETMLLNYLSSKNEHYLGVVHRLDTPVKGVMVFAKNKFAAGDLSKQISENKMLKIYHATVKGQMPKSEDTITDYLAKDGRLNFSKISNKNTPGSKRAVLHYKLIDYDKKEDTSLLEIHLETGRHHQIRVQLSTAGHPIIGDGKYGEKSASNLMLCAYSLTFTYPGTNKEITYSL